MKNIVILTGKNEGPVSIIMAGNHGNEVCGIKAFEHLIPRLEIDCGTVIFVFGNPRAIKKCVRFIEYNLNRLFGPSSMYSKEIKKTYEYKRAQWLKKIFDKGIALLDIHSTSNTSEPFIICERNANEIVSKFPSVFKRVVYGFDAIEPGASDGYMFSQDKIGICVECGQHEDPSAINVAKNAIYAFLKVCGHMHFRSLSFGRSVNREHIKMDFLYHTKTDSFVLARKFYDFESIHRGDIIGVDGDEIIKAQYDCVIVFAHNCDKTGKEAYLLGHVI